MATVKLTDETFDAMVLRESSGPTLVDFWAPWCGPCRAVAPVLEELSEELAGRLTIAKLDTDDNPRTAARFRIQSIPTMILFDRGRPIQAVQGALPKRDLLARIDKWLAGAGHKGVLIGADELAKRIASKERLLLIDLRREQDFARSHLKGSLCVPPENLEPRLAQFEAEGKDGQVVLICRSGEISREHAERLAKGGRRVAALEKGLLAWEGSGKPTYSNREEREEAERASSA
jgi:thioredoxin